MLSALCPLRFLRFNRGVNGGEIEIRKGGG